MSDRPEKTSVPEEQLGGSPAEDTVAKPAKEEPAEISETSRKPAAPETVTTPEMPAPEAVVVPVVPEAVVTTETTAAPAVTEAVAAPEAPAKTKTHKAPAAPETPEISEAPEVAAASEKPAVTETPEKPVAPKAPKTPKATAATEETETGGETVDFSEEDASLDADSPEFDLGDADESEEKGSSESVDYNGKSKAELVEIFSGLLAAKPIQTLRHDAEVIKIAFYKGHRADVEAQRNAFLEAGGAAEEFVPAADPAEAELKELFSRYREKRNEFVAGLDREKEANYKAKLKIIEELKELVDSGETLNNTFNVFRELQQRWKDTGAVPVTHVKDLWETYHLHVENFYNYIKINKELRDLDLKKNYEAKVELCDEAEALVLEPATVTAFHKLQKLHDRWRETGPVANEYKEQLWERFREASSKINKRHQEYFEQIKDEQKKNFDLKTGLCEKIEALAASPMSTRKEWARASDELIEVQKVWKTIGFALKKDNTKVYERFRNACDKFFENKHNFFLSVKAGMDDNLVLKNEICQQAEMLSESDDWKKATEELIELQKRWKEIGPVSRKYSDVVWKRFRKACDRFFERKSGHFAGLDSEYQQNLDTKRGIIEQIRNIDPGAGREEGFEAIKELQRRWSETGFVPIKEKNALQTEYRKAVDDVFSKLRGNDRERKMERFKGKISNMAEGGDRRMRGERDRLYNKMKQMESDIQLLENNIGFFARSKNSEQLIADVENKIVRLKEDMATIVEKINLIDNQATQQNNG